MGVPPDHVQWLTLAPAGLSSVDGVPIEVWELNCVEADQPIWSSWAAHFRRHYCDDALIDRLKAGTPFEASRSDYLTNLVFPDEGSRLGPAVRSGDFAEILVADLLEHRLAYWVPRTRYAAKQVRDESSKGVDVLGFRQIDVASPSPQDEMATAETKAQLSGRRPKPRLQDAVTASAKDAFRKAESLNAAKQRLIESGEDLQAQRIARFQDPLRLPYTETTYAAAVFCNSVFQPADIQATTDCAGHSGKAGLKLLVIRSDDFMALVNRLYQRAADEA